MTRALLSPLASQTTATCELCGDRGPILAARGCPCGADPRLALNRSQAAACSLPVAAPAVASGLDVHAARLRAYTIASLACPRGQLPPLPPPGPSEWILR